MRYVVYDPDRNQATPYATILDAKRAAKVVSSRLQTDPNAGYFCEPDEFDAMFIIKETGVLTVAYDGADRSIWPEMVDDIQAAELLEEGNQWLADTRPLPPGTPITPRSRLSIPGEEG